MTKHPQVLANLGQHSPYNSEQDNPYMVEVDEKLKDALELLNQKCFYTRNSCQDNFGNTWLQFDNYYIYEELMQRVLDFHNENPDGQTLWAKFFDYDGWREKETRVKLDISEDKWFYEAEDGNGELNINVSLRFKKEYLQEFEKLLEETLQNYDP